MKRFTNSGIGQGPLAWLHVSFCLALLISYACVTAVIVSVGVIVNDTQIQDHIDIRTSVFFFFSTLEKTLELRK